MGATLRSRSARLSSPASATTCPAASSCRACQACRLKSFILESTAGRQGGAVGGLVSGWSASLGGVGAHGRPPHRHLCWGIFQTLFSFAVPSHGRRGLPVPAVTSRFFLRRLAT